MISFELFEEYQKQIPQNLEDLFEQLKESELSTESFSFYTSVSAMASSKIEGETLEIDSYIKHKLLKISYQKDLIEKPNDLYKAYEFAQQNEFSQTNFLKAHALLSKHLLPKNKQGKCRQTNMVVMEHQTFRIQYEAAPATEVKKLVADYWVAIEKLKKQPLSLAEVFYAAAMLHLVFVNIHPFEDGNGRAARLLEKWFIAEKLGEKAWFLQSELYYYRHINQYYQNLNRLGIFYEQLDYQKALPFLLMLPNAIL